MFTKLLPVYLAVFAFQKYIKYVDVNGIHLEKTKKFSVNLCRQCELESKVLTGDDNNGFYT